MVGWPASELVTWQVEQAGLTEWDQVSWVGSNELGRVS